MAARLYLLGLGVDPVRHATLEVLQAAGRCDFVAADGLGAEALAFLKGFLAKGARLAQGASESRILAELKAGRAAGLVTPGHPYYWSRAAGRLVRRCEAAGIAYETFGSISPMGVALCAAGQTLGNDIYGIQSFEASAIAGRKVRVNPVWPLAVYFYAPLGAAGLAKTAACLAAQYPADHPVLWCAPDGSTSSLKLSELAGRSREVSSAVVLYLAAAKPFTSRLARTDQQPLRQTAEQLVPEPMARGGGKR